MRSVTRKSKRSSFKAFVEEHLKMQLEALGRLLQDDAIDIADEDEEAAESRLESLMDKDEWNEEEMLEISSLLFCLVYAASATEEEEEEGADDDD